VSRSPRLRSGQAPRLGSTHSTPAFALGLRSGWRAGFGVRTEARSRCGRQCNRSRYSSKRCLTRGGRIAYAPICCARRRGGRDVMRGWKISPPLSSRRAGACRSVQRRRAEVGRDLFEGCRVLLLTGTVNREQGAGSPLLDTALAQDDNSAG
jgi:hypothetical protein